MTMTTMMTMMTVMQYWLEVTLNTTYGNPAATFKDYSFRFTFKNTGEGKRVPRVPRVEGTVY